ncbi:MAG: CDP-diacylglycerol--serine O-phosphatidyltransferase [Bacteroidales bacterium]|nr:CDP-diacylglycerol--serine O-phosphatidyltransferase [Bacteroidales bacterium]
MKKIIPDCVTLLNLFCGICACILAMWGNYFPAFLFIVGAAVFDFLDGWIARLLKAPSELGRQLDSLCDMVSFGLAPTLMAFNWQLHNGAESTAVAYFAFIFVMAAALRLARFNIDAEQRTDFKGLAVPAAAMILAPMLAYGEVCSTRGFDSVLLPLLSTVWFIPAVCVVLGFLMVSRINMFSLKGKKLSLREFPRETIHFAAFLLIACPLAAIKGAMLKVGFFYAVFPLLLIFTFILYILVNLVAVGTHRKEQKAEEA